MSRSRRHSPFIGFTTARSDKPWKQQSVRKVRRLIHQTLATTVDGDALPTRHTITEPWGLKDGKQWLDASLAKCWRK